MMCQACGEVEMEVVLVEGIPAGIKYPRCGHTECQAAVMEMERGD